ncbi:MAG: 50S ribosomal protein L10 [Actinobacteria bacterium]|nr:50S ribosomal protein L10 [Actinomycetota bacterium]
MPDEVRRRSVAKPEKVQAVGEISERLREADAVLLTEYRGLHVSEIADVRDSLRAVDADLKVLKNTLARIAARDAGLEEFASMIGGPTAMAFVRGDVIGAAKALDEAARKYPVLAVRGGILDGKVLNEAQVAQLATIESREVLMARIAGLFNAPAQRMAGVAAGLLHNLGSMLSQVRTQKEESEAAA